MEVFLTKLHAHARVCSACVYACTHRRTHKPTNTYGDYDLYTYIHTCVRSYTHSCMHTYIYVWCMRVQPESDTHRQADRQTGRQTDRQTHTHRERERERERDTQTCTDRHTHTHTAQKTPSSFNVLQSLPLKGFSTRLRLSIDRSLCVLCVDKLFTR